MKPVSLRSGLEMCKHHPGDRADGGDGMDRGYGISVILSVI